MKAVGFLVGVSVYLVVFAGPARALAAMPCPGDGTNAAVVAEYLFLEGTGTNAVNTGIDEDDGNARLTYGAAFDSDVPEVNGECGWSVVFPNSGSGSTTPAVETDAQYDPLGGASSFTIMAWVKRESSAANQNTSARIISDTSSTSLGTNTAGFELRFSGSAGTLALRINGKEVSTSVGGIAPNDGTWHHVAVAFDGTRPATNTVTRNVHFYVDGIQRGDGNTLKDVVVAGNTNPLTVGNSSVSRGVGNLMVGKMDDVLILSGYAPEAVGNGKTNEAIRCYMLRSDDLEPPVIEAPADVTVDVDSDECHASNVSLGQPDASDECDLASVTNNAPVTFPVGVTLVTWSATDYAGNESAATQRVTVVDNIPPSITCPADITIYLDECPAATTNLNLGEPVVSDNCGVAGVVAVAPAVFQPGVTTVVWQVWDASGNTNSCEQTVALLPSQTADCDGDGLTDWEEVMIYGSDPANPGTAGDGLSDGWKVQHGLDPTVAVPPECRPRYW